MIGYRKLLAAGAAAVLGAALVAKFGDVPPGALTLLQTLFGAFVVGNAIENVVEARAAEPRAPDGAEQIAGILADMGRKASTQEAALDRVEQALAAQAQATSQNQQALAFIIERAFGAKKE